MKNRRRITKDSDTEIVSGNPDKLLHQYRDLYDEYVKKYGSRVAVLMQVGSFYEIYSYEPLDGSPPWTNLREIANVLVLTVAKKKALKGMEQPYLMAGVNVVSVGKFRDTLLDNGYIVVFIDQDDNDPPERFVTKVLTPGTQDVRDDGSNNLVVISIDNAAPRSDVVRVDRIPLSIGMASVDLSTGETMVHLTASVPDYEAKALDDAYRFLQAQCAKEVYVVCQGLKRLNEQQQHDFKMHVSEHLMLSGFFLRDFIIDLPKEKHKIEYQRAMLSKAFPQHSDNNSPIQQLGLELYPECVTALVSAVECIYECRPNALSGLIPPKIWEAETHLVLEHNAIEQLSLVSRNRGTPKNTTLFGVLNHTETSMGRRQLEQWLLNPLINSKDIEARLSAVDEIIATGDEAINRLREALRSISSDTIRLLRRADIREVDAFLQPNQLCAMYRAFNAMGQVFEWIQNNASGTSLKEWLPDETSRQAVGQWLLSIENTFNIEKLGDMSRFSATALNTDELRIFQHGMNPEVDKVFDRIDDACAGLDITAYNLASILHPDLRGGYAAAKPLITRTSISRIKDDTRKKLSQKVKLTSNSNGAYYNIKNYDVALLRWYCDEVRRYKTHIRRSSTSKKRIAKRKKTVVSTTKDDEDHRPHLIRWWKSREEFERYHQKEGGGTENDNNEESNSDEADDEIVEPQSASSFQEELQRGRFHTTTASTATAATTTTQRQPKIYYLSEEQIELISEIRVGASLSKIQTRIDIDRTTQAWHTIDTAATDIRRAVESAFRGFVVESVVESHDALFNVSASLANIDCLFSHARTALRYSYHRPTIEPLSSSSSSDSRSSSSFVQAEQLRHPIIERLLDDVEYVPHKVDLNSSGWVLFGTNNSGKTSYCKSVALNVIMAQCGCFVPAQSLRIRPFHNIITRLSGNDDMKRGKGTFAVEMSELRTILARATPKSLVLGDEICHGTEYPSAIGIVASSIENLSRRRTNFLFATHLHALSGLPEITRLENVHFKHFHVSRDPDTGVIVYDREMRDGSGPATYGIEVAEAQGIQRDVIERANHFRRIITNESHVLTHEKQSRYNAEVIVDQCGIPDCCATAEETHHIREQQTADARGIIDGRFHKNRKHNLVPLCKAHHLDVTYGRIDIEGWIPTADGGRRLNIDFNPPLHDDEEDGNTEEKQHQKKGVTQHKKPNQSKITSFWK